jgi:hypothetical protein
MLGGWLNPKTIQRIDVHPTHWRVFKANLSDASHA